MKKIIKTFTFLKRGRLDLAFIRTGLLVNWAFFGLALFVSAVLVFGSFLPGSLALKTVVVGTDSMEPEIPIGSLAIVRAAESYQVGESIAFKHHYGDGERIVSLQQVLAVDSQPGGYSYQVRPTAHPDYQPWQVTTDTIIGRTIISFPYLGSVFLWLRSNTGVWLTLILPLILLVVHSLPAFMRAIKNIHLSTKLNFPLYLKLSRREVASLRIPLASKSSS